MKHEQIKQSLMSDQEHPQPSLFQPQQKQKTFTKKELIMGGSLFIAIIVVMIVVLLTNNNNLPPAKGAPQSIRIALPSNEPTVIQLGNSRVLQVIFFSGKDDRNSDDYTVVSLRDITWSLSTEGIIKVDDYGRLDTFAVGNVSVRVQSKHNTSAIDQKQIVVVPKKQGLSISSKKRIVNFTGLPVKALNTPQKTVTKYSKQQTLTNESIPTKVKAMSLQQKGQQLQHKIKAGSVSWQIVKYADGSNRTYLLRIDNSLNASDRNKHQYFIGDRYLPGDGFQVISIVGDGSNGVWTLNSKGESTHIDYVAMSAVQKAIKMVDDYKPILRYGLASGSAKRGNEWVAWIDDNDGLWTSLFTMGELMRYDTLTNMKYSATDIAQARKSALTSLKAVLMISNVPCRNKVIDSKLRYMNNTRNGHGNVFNLNYLKEGKTYAINNYPGSAAEGEGFFGYDAGKIIDGLWFGGKQRYDYLPFNIQDWGIDITVDKPALTKRTIKGFIARSFGIYGIDTVPGGLFFKHNSNGTQTVLRQANRLYDFNADQKPVLDLGNQTIPEVLMDILRVNGVQYNKSDLFYKGDTSTDEVIGHIFLYKVAYDILDQKNHEEFELKKLISKTMDNFCTGLIDNGYNFVDATGYGTTWGKLNRDFINSDFTLQDAPVKAIEILMSLKVCGYVTGDQKWEKEYRFLIEDPSHRYLDVVASLWKRWIWRNFNEDYEANPFFGRLSYNQTYTQDEIIRHVMEEIHYSDDEQAMLAFYLAFQLQQDEKLLQKYRQGLQGWWNHISRSENPIWYYIYQLAFPNNHAIKDYFNNSLLDISAWHLSRHPVSTVKYTAYVQGSRADVISEGKHPTLSLDPFKSLGKRKHESDAIYNSRKINYQINPDYDPLNIYEIKVLPKDERNIKKFYSATYEQIYGGNPNEIQPPTTYTLPFWLGVYHKMIDIS